MAACRLAPPFPPRPCCRSAARPGYIDRYPIQLVRAGYAPTSPRLQTLFFSPMWVIFFAAALCPALPCRSPLCFSLPLQHGGHGLSSPATARSLLASGRCCTPRRRRFRHLGRWLHDLRRHPRGRPRSTARSTRAWTRRRRRRRRRFGGEPPAVFRPQGCRRRWPLGGAGCGGCRASHGLRGVAEALGCSAEACHAGRGSLRSPALHWPRGHGGAGRVCVCWVWVRRACPGVGGASYVRHLAAVACAPSF